VSEFKKDQFLPKSERESRIIEKLRSVLIHAYGTTKYYRELFDRIGFRPASFSALSQLERIPYLTKTIIRERTEDLISSAHNRSSLKKNATGGSTGVPLTLYMNREREIAHAAAIALNYEWAGLRIGDRLAMLWGSSFESTHMATIRGSLENIMLGRMLLPTFVLSEEILARYCRMLERFHPRVLLGYTSSLRTLAEYLENTNTHLPRLASVISGAETLYPEERTRFEGIFRCPVYNRYGGRDSGAVAAECPDVRGMHVNNDVVYVETDAHHNIIVTDLWNTAMPTIRYLPEDLGELSYEPCACGRSTPRFVSLEGRVNDLLVKPNGERVPGEFFPHLFKDIQSVKQYQVVQNTATTLEIYCVPREKNIPDAELTYLRHHISECFGSVNVTFHTVEHIEPTPSGKHRFTICNIPRA
jgi:phenylacetate-CoA ligase